MSYDGHYANVYDQIFHQEDMARSTADFLGALMPEHSAKALELGIGTGRVALRLAAKGHPIVGVDASQGMLDVLQEKLTEFDTYAVEVHLGDMATWEPLGEEKFELDVWYVEHRSFWLDLKILALTAFSLFRRHGISAPGSATAPEFSGNNPR